MKLGQSPDEFDSPLPCPTCGKSFRTRSVKRIFCSKYCKDNKNIVRNKDWFGSSNKSYLSIKNDPIRKQKLYKNNRKNRKLAIQWLRDYKVNSGCVDCGFNKHFAALELDHNGPKKYTIRQLNNSIRKMKEEIRDGNCVVRCTNCHAVKTWKEKLAKKEEEMREILEEIKLIINS